MKRKSDWLSLGHISITGPMAMPKAISHAIKHRLGALPWVSRGNSRGKGIMHSLGTNSLNWYCVKLRTLESCSPTTNGRNQREKWKCLSSTQTIFTMCQTLNAALSMQRWHGLCFKDSLSLLMKAAQWSQSGVRADASAASCSILFPFHRLP